MANDDAAAGFGAMERRATERDPQWRRHVSARRPAINFDLSARRDCRLLETIAAAAPGIGVLRRYRTSSLRFDLYAGVSVVAYLVPQVMAYTALVGVPPVSGLWTALVALVGYAALGSSRILSVGPESTIALVVGALLHRWPVVTPSGRWH